MADTVEPEVLVNAVLGKVSDVLLNGDGEVLPKSDDHFLAFLNIGIPAHKDDFNYALEGFGGVYRRNVDANDLEKSTGPQEAGNEPSIDQQLAADALQKYMQAESFHNLTNLIPDVSGIVESGRINNWNEEGRISDVYAMALQHSQVYDNEPDEATKAKLERWRSKLVTTRKEKDIITDEEVEVTEESAIVKRYNEKMLAYLAAATEYNNLRISAMAGKDQEAVHRMAINGPLLQMKVRAAMNDLVERRAQGRCRQAERGHPVGGGPGVRPDEAALQGGLSPQPAHQPQQWDQLPVLRPGVALVRARRRGLVGVLLQQLQLRQRPPVEVVDQQRRRRVPRRGLRRHGRGQVKSAGSRASSTPRTSGCASRWPASRSRGQGSASPIS
jgi:hypothetical protein